MEKITHSGTRLSARSQRPRSASNSWLVKRPLHASSMVKTEEMWIKAWLLSIKWCTHQTPKAWAPENKLRMLLLLKIITVGGIVTALALGIRDSLRPMCCQMPLVRSSRKSDLRPLRAPLLKTMFHKFHDPQSSLIALIKRLWMLTDLRMSIVWPIGSVIKSKSVRSYRCRALAARSVHLPIDLEPSALSPNVMASSIETSRMASSIGITKPRLISLSSIAFHNATTRTVWCMSPLLMPWLILISRFDMRTRCPRKTSAIAT